MTDATPDLLYWEDFHVGETIAFGDKLVTRDEVVEFAAEFDPQPFHLDDDAARDTLLGGLAASGWHSCAMLMRMICDDFLNRSAGMGGAGVDEVKWLKPVRPGDRLTARRTCTEARVSRSRPEMGLVRIFYEVFNQDGDAVMSWDCLHLFARRDPGADPESGGRS